jgi:hypothetical protein
MQPCPAQRQTPAPGLRGPAAAASARGSAGARAAGTRTAPRAVRRLRACRGTPSSSRRRPRRSRRRFWRCQCCMRSPGPLTGRLCGPGALPLLRRRRARRLAKAPWRPLPRARSQLPTRAARASGAAWWPGFVALRRVGGAEGGVRRDTWRARRRVVRGSCEHAPNTQTPAPPRRGSHSHPARRPIIRR